MLRVSTTFLALLLLSGCTQFAHRVVGNAVEDVGSNLVTPYLLKTDDVVIVCGAGEALPVAIFPLQAYEPDIGKIAVQTHMINGFCAYRRAVELGLESMGNIFRHEPSSARDALIRSRRWHTLAAKRFHASYVVLTSIYPGYGDQCPRFVSEEEEFLWLVGALTATQALLNNSVGGEGAEVPKDIAGKAERALSCLDSDVGNRNWWGLPQSLRASLWLAVPGLAPPQSRPWEVLDEAVEIGNETGVRMASALLALSLDNASRTAVLKDSIRRYAREAASFSVDADWRLLDTFAGEIVLALSDQLWMEERGHRTPQGRLGNFWDDRSYPDESYHSLIESL